MENLPAEIILLIFRNIYSRDEIETLQHITRIGAVNTFIHQVELKFWKQRLIDRSGSRLSGVLRKVTSPKLTYLGNYFGCTQCGQFAIFRCKKCPNLGCEDCYVNRAACECVIMEVSYNRPSYTCPDHKSRWRCHQCTAPICGDCFKMCWMCQNIYCERCIYDEEVTGRDHCGECYLPYEDPEIGVHVVPYMTELPSELLLSIFQFIFGDVSIPLIDRVKLVTRFGATSNVLRAVENDFWINVMNQTCGSWLRIKLKKFYLGTKEQSRVFLAMDLTNMPIKLRSNPKEVYLYGRFSCQQCGKKGILNECKKCQMNVCNYCGHQRQCQCHEFYEEDDFLCYYCHYKCTTCQRDLCLKCCGLCRICRRFYCYKCHSKEHKTETLLPHEEWDYASHIEEDFSDSDYYSDSDDLIGTCIQCGDEIYDEEDLGHCPSCEYYNEINSYKLCNKCIDTCQICHEQYCTNCMIMYHEPCEQWKMCPSCKSEVSQLLQCVECGSENCCEFCLQGVERVCLGCGKQKRDPMQID